DDLHRWSVEEVVSLDGAAVEPGSPAPWREQRRALRAAPAHLARSVDDDGAALLRAGRDAITEAREHVEPGGADLGSFCVDDAPLAAHGGHAVEVGATHVERSDGIGEAVEAVIRWRDDRFAGDIDCAPLLACVTNGRQVTEHGAHVEPAGLDAPGTRGIDEAPQISVRTLGGRDRSVAEGADL